MILKNRFRFQFKSVTPQSNSKSGFSMVELLLYMGLFMGFLVILSSLFVATLDAQTDSTTTSHTDQDGWYLFNRLQYDFYRADSIITPVNNGDVSSTLVLDVDGSNITYSLVNNKLSITENSVTIPVVSDEVTTSNLSFKKLGNEDGAPSIKIQMKLQNSVVSQNKEINFTLGLR